MAFNTLRVPLALLLLGAHGRIPPSTGPRRQRPNQPMGPMSLFPGMLKMISGLFVVTEQQVSLLRCVYLPLPSMFYLTE